MKMTKEKNNQKKSTQSKGNTLSAKENFQNKSLSYKISVAVAVLLIVCLTLLITISAALAGNSLSKTVNSEFEGIATENGLMVQSVVTTAADTATMIQNYMVDRYEEFEKDGYNGETSKSEVYNVELQEMNKKIEEFLISVATSTVLNSDGICGVGVFFEPDAFDPAIKDYTIYVNEDDAKNGDVQSYGSYSSYGSEDYYKNTATTQQDCFTEPYEDQGINMVSAAFPIVYNNETQGVILVDININSFSSLRSTDSKYPSMYVDIYNSDGIIIYDSESDEYIGQSLQDLISSKDYAKIQAGMDTGESFHVSTKKDNGSHIIRFYAPIQAADQTWWATSALSLADLNKSTVIIIILMV